jgi:hypothetical protein
MWRFVAPGLYRSEKNAFLPFLIASPLMFAAGAAVRLLRRHAAGLRLLPRLPAVRRPRARRRTRTPGEAPAGITFQGSVQEYLSLTIKFIVAFGLCFQLPVLLTLMGKAGLVSRRGAADVRKYAVVGILVLAALVTPPDVITQVILFVVVYGLYEVSIWLVRRVEKQARRASCARGLSSTRTRSLDDIFERRAEFDDDGGRMGRRDPARERRRDRAGPHRRGAGADGAAALPRRPISTPPRPSSGTPRPTGWSRCREVNRRRSDLLVGIDRARDTLLDNTRQFARGLPANNALLWGARGMGKSRLVKAVHAAVRRRGHAAEAGRDPARGPALDRAAADTCCARAGAASAVLRRPVLPMTTSTTSRSRRCWTAGSRGGPTTWCSTPPRTAAT